MLEIQFFDSRLKLVKPVFKLRLGFYIRGFPQSYKKIPILTIISAARIGQTLLAKNRQLQSRLTETENVTEELRNVHEKFTEENHQLKHQLNLKDELLRGYEEDQNRHQSECTKIVEALEITNERLETENTSLNRTIEELESKLKLEQKPKGQMQSSNFELLQSEVRKVRGELFNREKTIKSLEAENNEQFSRILELERTNRSREIKFIEQQKKSEAIEMSLEILKEEIAAMEDRLVQLKDENNILQNELKNQEESKCAEFSSLAAEMAQKLTPRRQHVPFSSTRVEEESETDSGLLDEECFYSEICDEFSTPKRSENSLPLPNIQTPKLQLSANKETKRGILQKLSGCQKGKIPLDYQSPGSQMVKDLCSTVMTEYDIVEEIENPKKNLKNSFSFLRKSFSFSFRGNSLRRTASTTEIWKKYPSTYPKPF